MSEKKPIDIAHDRAAEMTYMLRDEINRAVQRVIIEHDIGEFAFAMIFMEPYDGGENWGMCTNAPNQQEVEFLLTQFMKEAFYTDNGDVVDLTTPPGEKH